MASPSPIAEPCCPTVEQLEALSASQLQLGLFLVELARKKPYLEDRLRTAIALKAGL